MSNGNKIKLLIITPTLQCGGSERYVSMLCNNINSSLFSVCLVVVNNSNAFYSISNPAVEIIDLHKKRVLFSLPAIKVTVRRFKPVIIFSTANHLNLYLAIFKKSFNPRIVFIAREASIVSINSRQAKMPSLYNRLIKKYYRRLDHIICQSRYMQQDLLNHYHIALAKTSVISNAVPAGLDPLPPQHEQGSDRVYKFITVARLSEEKGIERLIHAAGLLLLPFKYYIIGDGHKGDQLQKLIGELQLGEKVFLIGEKADPFKGMEDADLYLCGSYYEGFPNVLLEAGACGIPVIAFNVPGGISEIITDKNGILVDDNDIIAFAAAIKTALAAGFNRQAITENTKDRFSVKKMMAATENLFMTLGENK